MLTRKPHWRTRDFHTFLASRLHAPYKWGENDCAMFAADGVLAQTGVDIASDFRGRYTTQAGAYRVIKSVCGGSSVADAAAYCAQKHDMTELVHPLMAQRGDLVIVENAGNLIAGLVHLNGRDVAAVGDAGLITIPITAVKRAWRVTNE